MLYTTDKAHSLRVSACSYLRTFTGQMFYSARYFPEPHFSQAKNSGNNRLFFIMKERRYGFPYTSNT